MSVTPDPFAAFRSATNDTNWSTPAIAVLSSGSAYTDVDVIADINVRTQIGGPNSLVLGEGIMSGLVARQSGTDAAHMLVGAVYFQVIPSDHGGPGPSRATGHFDLYAALGYFDGGAGPKFVNIANPVLLTRSAVTASGRLKLSVIGDTASLFIAPYGTSRYGNAVITGTDASLDTGGNNDTGKVGLYDACKLTGTSNQRSTSWENFHATSSVSGVLPAIRTGQSAEFRSDAAKRENSTGTGFGDIPSYRGANFFIPPAGPTNRVTRVVAKARRNDVNTYRDAIEPDDITPDSTSLQVKYTPRYLVIPRS